MDTVDSGEGPRGVLEQLLADDGAPQTTAEVADTMDRDVDTASQYLETLSEMGYVDSRTVDDTRLWWPIDGPVDGDPAGAVSVDDVPDGDASDADATSAGFDALSVLPAVVYRCRQTEHWPMDDVWGDCEAVTGYPAAALEGGAISYGDEVVHPDDSDRIVAEVEAARETGESFTVQYRIVTRTGETRWVYERGRFTDGDTRIGVITDIDAQQHAERELREERAFVESLFDAQHDVVYAYDREGEMRRWNDRLPEVTGYTDDELADMHSLDLVASEERDRVQRELAPVLTDGTHETVEFRVVTKDGDQMPYEITAAPLREDGQITGVTGVARDITDRVERERELEQQRDELESELSDVFERVDDAFMALDDEWRFTYVNDRATEVLEHSADDLLGTSVWDVFPEAVGSEFEEAYRNAMETQEPVSFESFYPPLDRWFEVTTYPSESGLSVYFQDVTERKARLQQIERANRRYRTLLDNFPNGAVTLYDTDLVCQAAGGENVTRLGLTEAEMVGEYVGDVVPDAWADTLVENYRAAIDGERRRFEIEDSNGLIFDVHAIPVRDDDGEVFAVLGMSQDVTERREYERELEHYETLARTAADVLVRVDQDSVIRDVNPAVADVFGYDPDALVGEELTVLMPDRLAERHLEGVQNYVETGERTLDWDYLELPAVRADGTEIDVAISFSEYEHDDERFFTGIIRDVTERKKREQALQDAYEIIADADRPLDEKIDDLLESTRQTLGMQYATLSSVSDDQYTFEYLQAPDDAEITAGTQIALGDARNCASVVADEETLVLQDIPRDAPDHEDPNFGIETYLGAPVVVAGELYGTFCFYGTEPRDEPFSDWEVTFVELLSNWVGYALDRERTTDQLEALNSLHNTLREITHAAFSQSTREEIEHAACRHLADSPSYEFAWIATHDPRTRTVEPGTAVGTDGYEDELDLSFDGEGSRGPTARAFRTREVQTVQNVFEDPDYEPWRDLAREYGFQSSAAIPIVHEETVYGVLNVYAARPNGFEGREVDVFAQFGEILGHAIAAAERKRALMSDELVEIEFAIDDLFGRLIEGVDHSGRIVIENTVPTGDGEFLVYGFVEGSGIEPLEQIVEHVPHWTNLNVVSAEDPIRFEVALSEPPVLTSVASFGGAVQHAEIVDGDYFMRIRLPREGDVRQVIETVQDTYPESEVLTHRQMTRDDDRSPHLQATWSDDLTDKQRSALEAAYHAGYFSWPRDASGEDLADSLGVSPPTFYQHLRAAEAKLFGALLGDDEG